MSHGREEDNTMSQMFGGRIKIYRRELDLVEQGYGIGIGHEYGSYALYMAQLRKNANIENGVTYLGKDIDLNTSTPTIVNPTVEFVIGDIPKILIEFHSLIDELFVNVIWRYNGSEDTILKSFYKVPSPYGKSYDWWDLYSVYFIGPENLGEGEYQVVLEAEDIKKNKLVSTVEFSVKYNDNSERSLIEASSTKTSSVETPSTETSSIETLSIKNKDNLTSDNLTVLYCEKIAYIENKR